MTFLRKSMPKVKGRKAVFLTITLVIFALTLFSFSSLFVTQMQRENFFVQGSIDRIVNLDASIQKSITDLFKEHSGIAIAISSNNITITENLPPDFSTFNSKLSSFKSFVEDELSAVTIDANIQDMPLNLTPKGIVYNHSSAAGKVAIQRADLAFAFEIKFTFPQGEEGACPMEWSPPIGSLRVKISAEDVLSSCESEILIDPAQLSEAVITHSRGNIRVRINNNVIEISRDTINAYILETKIELPSEEKIVSIKMPEIITSIIIQDFRIIGEARFLT